MSFDALNSFPHLTLLRTNELDRAGLDWCEPLQILFMLEFVKRLHGSQRDLQALEFALFYSNMMPIVEAYVSCLRKCFIKGI